LIEVRCAFGTALARWYRAQARTLPWRTAPTLYRTVVSEFMLQQTQVKTVLPYFARWMEALPDFPALAAAPESTVLKLWEGLGYYSRVRNLRRLAQILAAHPEPPRTSAGWRELPGVGPYTAAAIASIVFGEPVACVDGNVVRVLARLTGDATGFRDSASAAKALTPLAGALLSRRRPGDHNQAMMELGATVCVRHGPRCGDCPVLRFCAAAKIGEPETFPRISPKAIETRAVVRVWSERAGALLLYRAPAGMRRLADLFELPTAAQAGLADADAARGPLLARRHRGITRFKLVESIHAAPIRAAAAPNLEWVPLARLAEIAVSGPHRRWIAEILAARPRGGARPSG
jgi:A/G-specific adenine glycosylase